MWSAYSYYYVVIIVSLSLFHGEHLLLRTLVQRSVVLRKDVDVVENKAGKVAETFGLHRSDVHKSCPVERPLVCLFHKEDLIGWDHYLGFVKIMWDENMSSLYFHHYTDIIHL